MIGVVIERVGLDEPIGGGKPFMRKDAAVHRDRYAIRLGKACGPAERLFDVDAHHFG